MAGCRFVLPVAICTHLRPLACVRYPHDVNKMCVLFGPLLLLLLLCCFFLLLGCYKNYNSIQYYDVLKNVLFLIIIIINRDDDDDDFINTTITIITVSYPPRANVCQFSDDDAKYQRHP